MFVVIFDTLSIRVEKVINLGFETGIISLSAWPSFHYANGALSTDTNDPMQVRDLGSWEVNIYLFIWNRDE